MNANDDHLPVLIVGGGPTGLMAAMELSHLGVSTRLVERRRDVAATSRALAVQARTLELLRPRGLADAMVAAGNRGRGAGLYGPKGRLGRVDLTRIPSRYNYVLLLAQSDTEGLLRAEVAAGGVEIERGVELRSFAPEPDDRALVARLETVDGGREDVRCRYLIDASGAHSVGRHLLGLPFAGRSLPATYLLGDLHLDGDVPDDELSMSFSERGFAGLFPLGGGRFRAIIADPAAPPEPIADADPEPSLQMLQDAYDRAGSLPARFHDLVWSSRFRINSRHLPLLRVGRVFFGGDAAHVHSPAGGQGMNTGIQDMLNLCWKLALVYHGGAAERLLDTYQAERLPIIERLVRTTERATGGFASGPAALRGTAARILPLLLHSSLLQRTAAAAISQVTAGYRAGPLDLPGPTLAGLRAGDRMPDLEVVPAGATSAIPLYDLVDRGAPTLVSLAGAALPGWADRSPVRRVTLAPGQPGARGRDAAIARRLAGLPATLLVRPDGYLAGITTGNADGWQERLGRFGI